MTEKVRRVRIPRGKTVKTALIYSGRLAPIVEAQGYFNAVIDIRDMLFLRLRHADIWLSANR